MAPAHTLLRCSDREPNVSFMQLQYNWGDDAIPRVVGVADHPPNHPDGHFDDFGSFHAKGAQFLLGDGSVHWYDEQLNLEVWHALATRGGGDYVGGVTR